jgi:hypothetical protein
LSIARQRREAAAALAMLMEAKNEALKAAVTAFDDEAVQKAVVDLALLQQNNAQFLIYVLKHYAGSVKNLTGHSLVEAVQYDNETFGEHE